MTHHEVDLDAIGEIKVTALAGGVGGAKLVEGLAYLLPPTQLRIIVNTGDDFEHLGLTICPDLDTVMYTLAGIADPKAGWGLEGETYHSLNALARLGGPTWFTLGDKDLATHLLRTQKLGEGQRLTEVTHRLATALGIQHPLLPMTDAPYRTMVITETGEMPFQIYFVREKWQPVVEDFRWDDPEDAQPTPEAEAALDEADVVVICPSNPFVSIDPILNLPGVRRAIRERLVIAVSPIIGGSAVKGPAAKIFAEFGHEPSAAAVAEHYQDLLSDGGFVLDRVDAALKDEIQAMDVNVLVTSTMMPAIEQRVDLAAEVLALATELSAHS